MMMMIIMIMMMMMIIIIIISNRVQAFRDCSFFMDVGRLT
jgi:hypothetical protein